MCICLYVYVCMRSCVHAYDMQLCMFSSYCWIHPYRYARWQSIFFLWFFSCDNFYLSIYSLLLSFNLWWMMFTQSVRMCVWEVSFLNAACSWVYVSFYSFSQYLYLICGFNNFFCMLSLIAGASSCFFINCFSLFWIFCEFFCLFSLLLGLFLFLLCVSILVNCVCWCVFKVRKRLCVSFS